MMYSVVIHGKCMQVAISKTAEKELFLRRRPVLVLAYLIFGCMIAKRVWFWEETMEEAVAITNKLSVCLDVVRYTNCSFSNIDGGTEPEKYPLQSEITRYAPDYLSIVFAKNKFSGDFTVSRLGGSMAEPLHQNDSKPQV